MAKGLTTERRKVTLLYEDLAFTAQDEISLRELALWSTDPERRRTYPALADLGRRLGVSVERLGIIRLTPEYKRALREATKLAALEATAAAVPSIADTAAGGGDDSVQAFNALVKAAGVEEHAGPSTLIQNNIHTTLQDQVIAAAREVVGAAKVIDVEVDK